MRDPLCCFCPMFMHTFGCLFICLFNHTNEAWTMLFCACVEVYEWVREWMSMCLSIIESTVDPAGWWFTFAPNSVFPISIWTCIHCILSISSYVICGCNSPNLIEGLHKLSAKKLVHHPTWIKFITLRICFIFRIPLHSVVVIVKRSQWILDAVLGPDFCEVRLCSMAP